MTPTTERSSTMYKATQITENLIAYLRRTRLRLVAIEGEANRLEHLQQALKIIGVSADELELIHLGIRTEKLREATEEMEEQLGFTPREPLIIIEAEVNPCTTASPNDEPCPYLTVTPMPHECHGCTLEENRASGLASNTVVVMK